eukprot:1175335-Prorocentrum_minimum.AAC.1
MANDKKTNPNRPLFATRMRPGYPSRVPTRPLRTPSGPPPDPSRTTVQHTLKMPLVCFTIDRALRRAWRLDLTDKSPPDPLRTSFCFLKDATRTREGGPPSDNGHFAEPDGTRRRALLRRYRVSVVTLSAGGRAAVNRTDFAFGWRSGPQSAWGRPVDVLVMPDGALLVSDDQMGEPGG